MTKCVRAPIPSAVARSRAHITATVEKVDADQAGAGCPGQPETRATASASKVRDEVTFARGQFPMYVAK